MNRYIARDIAARLLPELGMWESFVRTRLPRSFDGLAEEADAAADQALESLDRLYGGECADLESLSEQAAERGQERYALLQTMETATYSAVAVLLYHWHEQWLIQLYRERLVPIDANEREWMRNATAWKAVRAFEGIGIHLSANSAWGKTEELRLLANAVKHGCGKSTDDLFKLRPDFFEPPCLDFPVQMGAPPSLLQPLGGFGGLYVSDSDLLRYCSALAEFWEETRERFIANDLG